MTKQELRDEVARLRKIIFTFCISEGYVHPAYVNQSWVKPMYREYRKMLRELNRKPK